MGSIAILLALVLLGAIILKASDWLSHRSPPADLAGRRRSFERRARAPDWDLYESHLQRPIPQALRLLFSPERLSAPRLSFGEIHLFLSPIDAEALNENWAAPGVLPFAYSEADPIYLRPGPTMSNAVFITYHDGSITEELASSIEAFAEELRVAT